MDEKRSQLTEEELKLIEETENFMKEVYSDPEVANAPIPPNMRENIFKEIRAREAAKEKQSQEEKVVTLTDEDREYIRLGKKYKKQQKLRKYYVLAAVLILAMAFGVTSMGGPKRVFETFRKKVLGRDRTSISSSEQVKIDNDISEEEIYEKIEEKFGFCPVRINYYPEGVGFLEGIIGEEAQGIHIIYGSKGKVKIAYDIRPNYKESSWGKDIEDELLDEYEMQVHETEIYVKKYKVEEGQLRWLVGFEYQDVSYSMLFMDVTQEEVERTVENLYFP